MMRFAVRQSATGFRARRATRAAALLAVTGWAFLAGGSLPQGKSLRVAKASPAARPTRGSVAALRERIAAGYPRLEVLYQALHRLEQQGWIAAEWGVSELGRRARFYRLTAAGRKQLGVESDEWSRLTAAIGRVLEEA